ncbi:MAG: AI-2E family transporter [Gemmatimonadota bacterium]|nr:AI-2E family transporter [Gemmatimonadota bacterium]
MPKKIPFSTPDVPPDLHEGAEPEPVASEEVLGRIDFARVAVVGLFVLAVLYTLHFAASFFLPIVVAVLLDFLLSPIVRALKRVRIPEPLGAGIVMAALAAIVVISGMRLAPAASGWLTRAPATFDRVEERLRELRRPVEQVSAAARQVEQATEVAGGDDTPKVQVEGPSLGEQIFGGTTALLGALTIVTFLTYFLLAAGDLFMQKMIRVLPQFRDKKRAVSIAREIEAQVSTHLFTVTLINIGLGVATGIICWLYGLPNPVLWGLIAGVFNFVPYIGAVATTAVIGLAAVATFDSIGYALLVPATFFAVNAVEGNLVTPMILGRTLMLNTVAVFVGLMFWFYIWGLPGAIIAVPMLVTMKIFCDHFESLAPVGEFLGR